MKEIPVLLLGVGGVGRELLSQILSLRIFHQESLGIRFSVRALFDSNSAIVSDSRGLPDAIIEQALRLKAGGDTFEAHASGFCCSDPLEYAAQLSSAGSLMVDCTASDVTTGALMACLEKGGKIVLANKKPLTKDWETFHSLTSIPGSSRWETTVGAGLPIITLLRRMVASGDSIIHMEGSFSSTLGFLMSGIEQDEPFSKIVQFAHRSGYTEPDVRDDLRGTDVARKALILARTAGWKMDLGDITIKGLFPEEFEALSRDTFMARLETLDQHFANLAAEASTRQMKLRYVGSVSSGQGIVGPRAVPENSALGQLKSSDNLFQVHSKWYQPDPIVVRGRGAGLSATAAGVLADMLELTSG